VTACTPRVPLISAKAGNPLDFRPAVDDFADGEGGVMVARRVLEALMEYWWQGSEPGSGHAAQLVAVLMVSQPLNNRIARFG